MDEIINVPENNTINSDTVARFCESLALSVWVNTSIVMKKFFTHDLSAFIISLIKEKMRMYCEYRNYDRPEVNPAINQLNKII